MYLALCGPVNFGGTSQKSSLFLPRPHYLVTKIIGMS